MCGLQVAWLRQKQISAGSKGWMGVMISMVYRRQCCIYRRRSSSEYNGSCMNVRDIHLGLWWHNTAWLSHNVHMALGGCWIPKSVCSDQGSGHHLGCNEGGPCGMVRHGWERSGWPAEHGRVGMEWTQVEQGGGNQVGLSSGNGMWHDAAIHTTASISFCCQFQLTETCIE